MYCYLEPAHFRWVRNCPLLCAVAEEGGSPPNSRTLCCTVTSTRPGLCRVPCTVPRYSCFFSSYLTQVPLLLCSALCSVAVLSPTPLHPSTTAAHGAPGGGPAVRGRSHGYWCCYVLGFVSVCVCVREWIGCGCGWWEYLSTLLYLTYLTLAVSLLLTSRLPIH